MSEQTSSLEHASETRGASQDGEGDRFTETKKMIPARGPQTTVYTDMASSSQLGESFCAHCICFLPCDIKTWHVQVSVPCDSQNGNLSWLSVFWMLLFQLSLTTEVQSDH